MKTKNLYFFGIFITIVTFTFFHYSCSKEVIVDNSKDEISSDLLIFTNTSDYTEALNTVISLNSQDLKAYEESRGYKSFGRTCDELYSKINPERFKNTEEVKDFVKINKKYFQLIEDENGELILETRLFKDPNRYLINKEYMFQVSNIVYKVLDDVVLATELANISTLRLIDEKNVISYKNNPSIQFLSSNSELVTPGKKDAAYNCGTAVDEYESDGNDRTHMWLTCSEYPAYDPFGLPITRFNSKVLIRPYKRTLGIWYWCTRTVSCDVSVAIDHYYDSNYYRETYSYANAGTSTSKLEVIFIDGLIGYGHGLSINLHFGGFDAWADTPSAPIVRLQCNTFLCP